MSEMFPACAGMNRGPNTPGADAAHVPRVRGDEPVAETVEETPSACSPRARG